jgi:GxxExxY protein
VIIEGEKTGLIIGAAIEVHRNLGPGLLESTYEECLIYELNKLGLSTQRQLELPIIYKGKALESKYRLDILVDNQIIIELKSCKRLEPIHEAQILTYLKMANLSLGLLINFNVQLLKDGIKRLAN